MQVRNISNKVIGLGNVMALPGETKEVPSFFESHPILVVYREQKLIEIIGEPKKPQKSHLEVETNIPEVVKATEEKTEAESYNEATEDIKALRAAQLKAIKSMNNEEVGKLAKELGINPASCKDQADVRKKVTAELKKQS